MKYIANICVDTFGALRDESSEAEEKLENNCFVCGLHKHHFEGNGGLKKHVEDDHNCWSYMFFIIDVVERHKSDPKGLTALESFVATKLTGSTNDIRYAAV